MNCEKCGQPIHPGSNFCENCGHTNAAPEADVRQPQVELKKPENVALGFVGALVGALLGGASIILFGQLGVISAVSGLVLAFCTIKGYELLAKGRGTVGTILCIALMAITPYFADRLSIALILKDVWHLDVPLSNVFAAVPELVAGDAELSAEYWKNLLLTYGFAALGAFGILKGMFDKKK